MKKHLLVGFLLVASILMSATPLVAQGSSPPPNTSEQPPKVGDLAPDFTLPTLPSGGKLSSMRLSDLQGKKKVLLAFYVFDFTGG
jgi:AhpC/TSA family